MLKKVLLFFFIGVLSGTIFIYYKKRNFINKGDSMSKLDILFFEDSSLPYIRYTFASLKGGADYNSVDKSGLAAVTGYLLDQGSKGMTSEKLQDELNYYGTELDVEIGRQSVDLSLGGLSQHAIPLLNLFLKIILEPSFDSKELEILRNRMIEGRLNSLDDPSNVGSEIFREKLFGKNSIGQTAQGFIPSLKSITREDIQQFYKEHYRNSPTVFMVVGKLTPKLKNEIRNLIKSAFTEGALESFSPKPYKPENSTPFFDLVSKKDLIQSQVYIGHTLPSYPKHNPREATALKLGLSILGGRHLSSRLLKRVREELGLTYGIFGSATFGRSYGVFKISGATKTKTTKQFIQETLSLVNDFVEKGITQEELETAKNLVSGFFSKQIETQESAADFFLYTHYFLGLNKDYSSRYLSIIKSISLEEVSQSIKKYIHPQKINILVYGNPDLKNDLEEIKPLTKTTSFKEYFSKEISL